MLLPPEGAAAAGAAAPSGAVLLPLPLLPAALLEACCGYIWSAGMVGTGWKGCSGAAADGTSGVTCVAGPGVTVGGPGVTAGTSVCVTGDSGGSRGSIAAGFTGIVGVLPPSWGSCVTGTGVAYSCTVLLLLLSSDAAGVSASRLGL
jgi:hypothetical protein